MSTTPEELSKSYDEHLRIFEQALDSGKTPPGVRGGPSSGKSKPRSISKASGSPTRDRSGSRSMSPAHGKASAVRANSNPGEVIIGFAPSERSSSPEETTLSRSQERSLSLSRSSGGASSSSVPPPNEQLVPVKPAAVAPLVASGPSASVAPAPVGANAGNAAAGQNSKGSNKGKQPKSNDPRGPKIDVKSLSKAERRELAQKEQELAKSRKQQAGGGKGAAKTADSSSNKGKSGSSNVPAPARKESVSSNEAPAVGAASGGSSVPKTGSTSIPRSGSAVPAPAAASSSSSSVAAAAATAAKLNRVPFFMHLPEHPNTVPAIKDANLHPAIVRLGAKYVDGSIMGSSARCVALVEAVKCLVADYKLPARSEFAKHFVEYLRPNINFVVDCRPKSVSMGNFIRAFKNRVTENRGRSEVDGKASLQAFLEEFLDERFLTAQSLIVDNGVKKIVDGDVIMTFACSYVVSCVLIAAHQSGKRFRVVVVDSSPLMEGKEFLKRMTGVGIQCSYVLLNAVCYMMKSVTKVLVGAYALLSNGNLVSRVGTAAVAMAAHEWSVPVIVCSETIKFSEKTLLDSITWNELGNADDLAVTESGRKPNVLANWRDVPHLTLLSLLYDVTPMDFITMVITEFGMIPPTSVPVILREEYGNKKERN